MKIKFCGTFFQLQNNYFTNTETREFIKSNPEETVYEATRHGMNHYKLENGLKIHVYDVYEVKTTQTSYAIQGLYVDKYTKESSWSLWQNLDSLEEAIRIKEINMKFCDSRFGYKDLRVVEIVETTKVIG